MRFPLLIVALLITVSSVSAAEYWTVFDDNGPTSDVVNGANFAASMKGTTGVSFTGKTESQAASSSTDLDDVLIVRLDGQTAKITYGDDPTFDAVVNAARSYFRDQGFSVTVQEHEKENEAPTRTPSPSTPDDDDDNEERDETQNTPQETVNEDGDSEAPSQESDAVEPTTPIKDEESPGFFTRIWRWFAGIFD